MRIGQIDLNKLGSLGQKSAGFAKEFVGIVVGNDRLQQEGEAQQARASEQLKALEKEVEAQAKDAKARVYEGRERVAQQAKSSS